MGLGKFVNENCTLGDALIECALALLMLGKGAAISLSLSVSRVGFESPKSTLIFAISAPHNNQSAFSFGVPRGFFESRASLNPSADHL